MATILLVDYERVEALAKAASPGPWNANSQSVDDMNTGCHMTMEWIANGVEDEESEYGPMNQNHENDAAFIAAMNPAMALDIVADVNKLIKENERLYRGWLEIHKSLVKEEKESKKWFNHFQELRASIGNEGAGG